MSVKSVVTSRFQDGCLIEADYSQLEIIGLAFLSQDEQLIADINAEVDMHCMSASFLTGEPYDHIHGMYIAGDPYWTKVRKTSKGPSFQLTYGAGAKSIAEQNGISLQAAKQFIDNYYARYSRVKEWQNENIQKVNDSAVHKGHRTNSGIPARTGTLKLPTGRILTFHEYDAPSWMDTNDPTFSPTEIKNYPVQSLSTGDVVPMMLGEVLKLNTPDTLFINTVHDSYLFDINRAVIDPLNFGLILKHMLESAPTVFKRTFGTEFNLPLRASVDVGENWGEMQSLC